MNKEMTVVQCQWVHLMQCDIKKTSIIKNNRINNSDITQTIQHYIAKAFLGKHKEIDGETKVKSLWKDGRQSIAWVACETNGRLCYLKQFAIDLKK